MKDEKEKRPDAPQGTLDYQPPVLAKLGVEKTAACAVGSGNDSCGVGVGASGCLVGSIG